MMVRRWAVLLTLLTATGLGVVAMRSAMTSKAWQIQNVVHQQDQTRQQVWSAQIELSRLTAPSRIRQQATELQLCLTPPDADQGKQAVAQAACSQARQPWQ